MIICQCERVAKGNPMRLFYWGSACPVCFSLIHQALGVPVPGEKKADDCIPPFFYGSAVAYMISQPPCLGVSLRGKDMLIARTKPKYEQKKRKFYVCDRKRCTHCAEDCHHTTDINHALYEDHTDFVWLGDTGEWEVIR